MCPGYKWPLLLRRKKSRDALSEVTVLEVTPWEVSFVPFLHNANPNPENSPILTVFSLSCSHAVGARAVPPAGTMHSDGCQRCSGKLQTISHPTPSSTEVPSSEDTAALGLAAGLGHPLPKRGRQKDWAEQIGKVPSLYTVVAFCSLRIKLPLRFKRLWLQDHGSHTFQFAQSWWQGRSSRWMPPVSNRFWFVLCRLDSCAFHFL